MMKKINIPFLICLFSIHIYSENPNFIDLPSEVSVPENSQNVLTISASDPDGSSIKFSIANSFRDSSSFKINKNTGVLKFKERKDFENPSDDNTDNEYLVKIRVTDQNNESATATLTVIIYDVDDVAPEITNLGTVHRVTENHKFVKRFIASDVDTTSDLEWSLDTTYKDTANFQINSSSGKLWFNEVPDFEDESLKKNQKVKIVVSDGTNSSSGTISVKIKNAATRTVNFSAAPVTHIILDTSTPTNLLHEYENTIDYDYLQSEPISYTSQKLNKDLKYGSYPYTLVAGFVGYWSDYRFGTGTSMSNDYDEYLVDTSSEDDALYIRLEQPKANPDCGTNDLDSGGNPICSLDLIILKYDSDFGYYYSWKSISTGARNKTIKLPSRDASYLIRVAASSEMSGASGNSDYYLYAYRAGNTPGNILDAFSMVNHSNRENNYAWYRPDLDLSSRTDWEFAEDRILVYKRNNSVKPNLANKRYFNEVQKLANEFILLEKGFSVVTLNQNQIDLISEPANKIINTENVLLNTDSINGDQPPSPLINQGYSSRNSIENVVSVLSKLYPDNEFSVDFKVEAHNFKYDPDYIRYQKEYFDMVSAEDGLNAIGTYDVADVVVAVIDTGSPSKGSRAWKSSTWIDGEYDFVSSDFDATDPSATMDYPSNGSHGTHVATTIAAKNDGKNINGFGLKVLPLRVLDENGSGWSSDICNAIAYAGQISNSTGEISPRKANVINMSLGGGSSCSCQSVVDDVYNAGVVIVASAGNGYVEADNYPASCDNVLSVSSIGTNGHKADYSNYGQNVDVSAPGGDVYMDEDGDGDWDGIWAFTKDNKLQLYQGTSMAAPIAASAIGNVFAVNERATPPYIDNLIKKRLIVSDEGNEGFDRIYGYGLVDISKVASNSNEPNSGIRTKAVITSDITNLYSSASSSINIKKVGNAEMSVTNTFTSHQGISVSPTSEASANDGFGDYFITIDESAFNDNQGRFQEMISFEITDSYVVDVINHPVVFQIGGLSDARNPSNLGRMHVLAAIWDNNEQGQAIKRELFRIEGNTDYTQDIEDAIYRYSVSTNMDLDGYICDFGEICFQSNITVNANDDINYVINGNTLYDKSSSKKRSSIGIKID